MISRPLIGAKPLYLGKQIINTVRNLIVLFFLSFGFSSLLFGQPLEATMSRTWNGVELDPFQMEWTASLEKNLSDGSYFLPSTIDHSMVGLRKVKGKYIPYRLFSAYQGSDYYTSSRLYKSVVKKFNSGFMTWDSLAKRAYFTSRKGTHFEIYSSDRVIGKSRYLKKKKATILPFQYNNKGFSVAWPSVSPDGQQLYFASDMPGGRGGWDIYLCDRNGSGWDPPQNLSDLVNSDSDEQYPFISEEGILYFSSDRKGDGLGGFDIYRYSNEEKSVPMPYPVNSVFDDLAISMPDSVYRDKNTLSGKPVFVLSSRPKSDSAESGPLSVFQMQQCMPTTFSLEHKRKMHPLVGFKVEIDDDFGHQTTFFSDSVGQFSFLRAPNRSYNLKITYPGMDTVNTSSRWSSSDKNVILIDNYKYWEVDLYVTHKRSRSPLERAQVIVIENEVKVDTVYTDEKGKAQLDLNRDFAYRLLIQKPGFKLVNYTPPKPKWNKFVQNYNAPMPEMRLTMVQGKVRDQEGVPAQGVEIEVFSGFSRYDVGAAVITNPEGEFEVFLPRNSDFAMVGRRNNNEVGAFSVTTDQFKRSNWLDTLDMDMKLVELQKGEVFATFLYEGDPILLQAGRYPEMTTMLRYMHSIPGLKIELGVHTDTKKGGQASWREGKNAADFAADYFYINDIARDRVITKSFGRSKPVTRCGTCSEADHQSNRRVEIRILEN
jgi:outer membrane protein OmpA-like peptidoglycan-associated protein